MDSFKGLRICFLADKHDLYDDRIYWKMAVPFHKMGAEVHYYLIADQDAEGTTREGIRFRSWKRKRFSRNLFVNYALKRLDPHNNYRKLFRAAAALEAEVYHFHDLWINRIATWLKALPHRPVVFYDAREPYADDYRSFYGKGPLSSGLVDVFAARVDRWEKRCAKAYDLVIANEALVRERFAAAVGEERAVVIHNFSDVEASADLGADPDAESAADPRTDPGRREKSYDLIYCGMLTEPRGSYNLLASIREARKELPGIKLLILGRIDPSPLKNEMLDYVRKHGLQDNVEIRGQVPFERVGEYYRKSRIGLILWNPLKSLGIKMPIKLFEYMAYGLPVIGSDFGHIREYIDKDGCGVTVDPENPAEVARAMVGLLQDNQAYEKMSRKGIDATEKKYRWKHEFERLCGYYTKALNDRKRNK